MWNEPYIIISSPVDISNKKIFISIIWKEIKSDFLVGKPKKKNLYWLLIESKKNQRKGTLGMKTFLLVGTSKQLLYFI